MPIVCKRFITVNAPPDLTVLLQLLRLTYPKRDREQLLTVVDEPRELSKYLGPRDRIPHHFARGTASAIPAVSTILPKRTLCVELESFNHATANLMNSCCRKLYKN